MVVGVFRSMTVRQLALIGLMGALPLPDTAHRAVDPRAAPVPVQLSRRQPEETKKVVQFLEEPMLLLPSITIEDISRARARYIVLRRRFPETQPAVIAARRQFEELLTRQAEEETKFRASETEVCEQASAQDVRCYRLHPVRFPHILSLP